MSYLSSVFRRGGGGGVGKHLQLTRYYLTRCNNNNNKKKKNGDYIMMRFNNKVFELDGIAVTSEELLSTSGQSVRRVFFSTQTKTTTATTFKLTNDDNDRPSDDDEDIFLPPPPSSSIESVIENLDKAAGYNFGKGGQPTDRRWDVDSVRNVVGQYEYYLKLFHESRAETMTAATTTINSTTHTEGNDESTTQISEKIRKLFLSPETTQKAFRALLRCKADTTDLSQKVREWERYLGNLGETPMTDDLSLMMIHANGKSGNIGRTLSLLTVRKSRNYPPKPSEFVHCITAIEAAGLDLRRNRNPLLSEKDQPQIDDPTRWLDAILLNMNQRGFTLTTELANRMLNTYSTTGKSGKAVHYFYKVHRTPIEEDDNDDDDNNNVDDGIARYQGRRVKIRIKMNPPPPYHKLPSQVKGKLVPKPGTTDIKQLKLDRESDPNWSPALTAAISFADSLKQGACGHEPIELNLISYSILMKVCCNRGSLWRAMEILDEVMPSNGIEPDVVSYNTLFTGLSRVGDVPTMREYFTKMLSVGTSPSPDTIRAIVDGNLNLGDVPAAITLVQDCFNQHSVLPPYTTHLKIIEFALGRGLAYEAKRHIYFIQQLWRWQRNDYHTDEFARMVELTKKNPKLSKDALKRIFAYFGETLEESDFL